MSSVAPDGTSAYKIWCAACHDTPQERVPSHEIISRLLRGGQMTPARVIDGPAALKEATGQEVAVSDWVQVTQDMINRFADLTGDHQWIHVDEERAARESPFHATIAHGFLTVSLISRLLHDAVNVRGDFKLAVNYGFNRLRFPAPVIAGSHVRAHIAVNAVCEVDNRIEVAWGILVEIEGKDKPAVAAEWLTRMYRE